MKKTFVNNSQIPQIYYDQVMEPHCVQPGESVELEDGKDGDESLTVYSIAPVGMYKVKNIYIDSTSGRMTVEYEV